MKILGIHGGPHASGNNMKLLKEALFAAEQKGAQTELVNLIDFNIEYCHGCMKCMEIGKCVLKDDFLSIKQKMNKADGIIFASPSYGMKPTARMKNFITDRLGMYSVYTSEFAGKYFAAISTAGAFGAKITAKDMAESFQVGFFKNAYVTSILGVSLSRNFDFHRTVDSLPKETRKAKKMGEGIVCAIEKGKTYPMQKIIRKLMTKLVIQKMILKNIRKNKDTVLKAVYEYLLSKEYISAM